MRKADDPQVMRTTPRIFIFLIRAAGFHSHRSEAWPNLYQVRPTLIEELKLDWRMGHTGSRESNQEAAARIQVKDAKICVRWWRWKGREVNELMS